MSSKPAQSFDQWCVVELMGHVKIAGIVTEEERFGAKMGRVDIPDGDGGFTTQYFGGSSVYRVTPVTEEVARLVAVGTDAAPIHPWQVRRLTAGEPEAVDADEDEDRREDGYGDEFDEDDDG